MALAKFSVSKDWFFRLAKSGVIALGEAMIGALHWRNLQPMWANANFRKSDCTRRTSRQLNYRCNPFYGRHLTF